VLDNAQQEIYHRSPVARQPLRLWIKCGLDRAAERPYPHKVAATQKKGVWYLARGAAVPNLDSEDVAILS